MKPVLVFVLAFLLATAGGAGATKLMHKTPPPKPGADSTHADSTRADSTHADSSHAAPADSSQVAHTSATDTAVVPSGMPVKPPADTAKSPAVALKAAPTAPIPVALPTDTSERRLSKVFTAMAPKETAKVFEH